MLHIELDAEHRWAMLKPDGALDADDFKKAAAQIDPIIAEHGKLNGLIIYVEKFPGWDSFSALQSHFRFVQEHHRNVRRIAVVTDSMLGDIAESVASHFVAAEIKHFPYASLSEAKAWVAAS